MAHARGKDDLGKRLSFHRRRLSREEQGLLNQERKIKAAFFQKVKLLAHMPDEDTYLKFSVVRRTFYLSEHHCLQLTIELAIQ